MAKVLTMPIRAAAEDRSATTAPQDVSREDAVTFEVLRQMREDILCCVLKPDQRLRFGELRQRYDTSIGTLREALSHLVSEGLARTEAGRGFQVAPISLADFLDLSELRIYLETKTLADAIRHGTDAWEAEIVSSHFLLSKLAAPKSDDPVSTKREWAKRHKRFHDSLVATCSSPWSLHFRSELFDQARRYHWLTMIHSRSHRRNEHLELRDAVLARDGDLACSLLEQHIRITVEQAVSDVPGLIRGNARPLRPGKPRKS
jgi:GntR family transcriptional regulator, carbon starvation induced regulator